MRRVVSLIAGTAGAVAIASATLYTVTATPKPVVHIIKPAVVKAAPAPVFNKTLYSTTDPASLWVVVNKQHPLPSTYIPANLLTIDGQQVRSEAAVAFAQMKADAGTAGYPLTIVSGYRSYATQVQVYNQEVKTNGQAGADAESARPGFSEHQTGLAMDIGTGTDNLQQAFGATPAGQWLAANSYKYGFILRYPNGLTSITGYEYEPWHFRFVGVALSTEMHNDKVQTLEQFFNVSGGPNYSTN